MVEGSQKWLEAKSTIDEFKNEFELKYGIRLRINLENSKHCKIPDLSITDLMDQVNEVLFEYFPGKIVKCRLGRNVAINNGILSKVRVYEFMVFKHIFCYIARDLGYSYSTIGRALDCDHATVINACKSIKRSFTTNYCDSKIKYEDIKTRIISKHLI